MYHGQQCNMIAIIFTNGIENAKKALFKKYADLLDVRLLEEYYDKESVKFMSIGNFCLLGM